MKIFKTGLIAGIAMVVANLILGWLTNISLPQLQEAYMNPAIFREPNDPLMILFLLYPLILGFGFAWIWDKTKQLFVGNAAWKKGLTFALIYLFVFALPALLINFSSFVFPFLMVFSWTVMSFLTAWVGGAVLAKINK